MHKCTEFHVPVDGWDSLNGRLLRKCIGGGPSAPSSTTSTQVNYSPEEQAARNMVQSQAASLYGQQATGVPNPQAAVVPFSPQTIAAQNYVTGVAAPTMAGQAASANNALQFGMHDIVYGQDPTLQNAIDASVRPITQAYADPGGLLSQERTEMMGNNMLGSTRDMMMSSILGGRYAQAVGDTASKLAATSRADTLNTYIKSLALGPQTQQMELAPAQAVSAVGNQNELLQQAQADKEAQDRLWALNYPWMQLNNYANIVYGGSNPGTTSTSTGTAPRSNPMMGIAGGAAAGGAIAGPWGAAAGALLGLLSR